MAKTKLFQIFDRTAESVGGPIMASRIPAPAIREFHTILGDPNTMPGKYPEQYELREVGEQDETTGEITGGPPKTITTGEAWIEQQQRNRPAEGSQPSA